MSSTTELPEARAQAAHAQGDELLDCLLILARSHGEAITRDGALAGLPLENGKLTPSLFERAAHRAGLSSKVVREPIARLKRELLPAIVLLDGERASVLLDRSADGSTLTVVYPELGDAPMQVAASDLESQYTGHAIYARPRLRFDARSPVVNETRRGHWFWSVIA